jgi:hypothetical protein
MRELGGLKLSREKSVMEALLVVGLEDNRLIGHIEGAGNCVDRPKWASLAVRRFRGRCN